jgi:uncharacterized tellurite resistance protein B-like protein
MAVLHRFSLSNSNRSTLEHHFDVSLLAGVESYGSLVLLGGVSNVFSDGRDVCDDSGYFASLDLPEKFREQCTSTWMCQMSKSMQQVDLLRAACCVAGADGSTTDPERKALQKLADRVGIGKASLGAMIECAETDERFLETQFRIAVKSPQSTLQLLFKMAIIDGRLHKEEVTVLKRLAERIGVASPQFDEWLKQSISRAKKKSD